MRNRCVIAALACALLTVRIISSDIGLRAPLPASRYMMCLPCSSPAQAVQSAISGLSAGIGMAWLM